MSIVLREREKERAEFNLVLFVVATLSYNLISLAVNLFVGFFLPNTPIDTVFCLLVYFYLLFRALPVMIERISGKDLVFVATIVLLLLLSMLREDNFTYIYSSLPIFPKLFLYYFIGRSVWNDQYVEKVFFKATPYIIAVSFVIFVLTSVFAKNENEDNMSLAYFLLPFSIFSALKMIKFKEKRIFNILVFIGALFLQIWTGTRGPLLCLLLAIVIYLFVQPNKSAIKFFFILILLIAVIFMSSNLFTEIVQDISISLEQKGKSNRIVNKFLKEELFSSSGRDSIIENIVLAIEERPFLGYGLFSDRAVLNGSYCHNIFFELLINFGIVIGGVLFVFLVYWLAISLFRRRENSALFLMLTCVGFVKLFLSSSYIIDPMFFLLLGAAFTKPKTE